MLIDYRALRNQIPMKRVLDLIDSHPTSRGSIQKKSVELRWLGF